MKLVNSIKFINEFIETLLDETLFYTILFRNSKNNSSKNTQLNKATVTHMFSNLAGFQFPFFH